jgi:hypothetical protein
VFNRVLTILKAVAGMEINGRQEIQFIPSQEDPRHRPGRHRPRSLRRQRQGDDRRDPMVRARGVFYLIADKETNTKLQINQAQYDHMLANAKKLQERLPGIQAMPTAARMTRKVYKRAFLGNELLQKGNAPIKGR